MMASLFRLRVSTMEASPSSPGISSAVRYVSEAAGRRPEARALAHFYLAPENARFALEVGDLPLPTVTLLAVSRRLDKGLTGSVFGGRGSLIGVTTDAFQDEDKVKNALVR